MVPHFKSSTSHKWCYISSHMNNIRGGFLLGFPILRKNPGPGDFAQMFQIPVREIFENIQDPGNPKNPDIFF